MLLAGGMDEKQWRDTGLSKLLSSVVMLPACMLAMRIISQVSVAVRCRLRTGRSQLLLQRLDVRDSVAPIKDSRTLEFIFGSELLLVPRNLLNTAVKIRNNLTRHEGLFLRKCSFFL